MNLRTLTPETFLRQVHRVRKQLAHPEQMPKLLDAARADTPMIDMVLYAMHRFGRHKGRSAREALVRAESDLITFLALRALEAAPERESQPAGPDPCCGRFVDGAQTETVPARAG